MELLGKECQQCAKTFVKRSTCSLKDWNNKSRFCSTVCAHKAKDRSYLVKYQIKKGQILSESTQFSKGQNLGSSNIKWKGSKASYAAKHIWMKTNFGSPQQCDHCGTTEKRMYHWANISKEYKRDRDDWMRLCVPCHKRYDLDKLNERSTI